MNNVELFVGGLAEDHAPGSSMGPTFQAIIANQFERIRDGDRLWYQNIFSGARSEGDPEHDAGRHHSRQHDDDEPARQRVRLPGVDFRAACSSTPTAAAR